MSYDWTPERYRRRQPSCWDPPWTRRTTAYQQSSSYELDMYSPSPPRRRPTCWDPPRSRDPPTVPPYDQLSPRYRREPYGSPQTHPTSRRASRGYSDYDQPPHNTRRERYEQLIDLLDAATSKLESQFEEIDRRLTKLQASRAACRQQPYADFDSGPPRHRQTCWDPPFQTSNQRVGETRAPPQPEPPIYRHSPYTDLDSSYEQPRQSTTSTCRHPPYSSDEPPQNSHIEYRQWRHEYKPSESIPPPPPPSHRSATPLPAAPLPPGQSDRPPQQSIPAFSLELSPLQPLPVTAPLLAANPHPQAVPSSLKKDEEDLLDDVSSPPAMFSPSCNTNFSGKKESLLEDGVAREMETIDDEASTAIMKETNLLKGDENGLTDEVVNCPHEVSYPSVVVCALTCAGGSDFTREKDVGWNKSIVKVGWKENAKGPRGLVVGKGGAVSDIFKLISLIPWCAFDPGICGSFRNQKGEFLALQIVKPDLRNSKKKLPHEEVIKCLFATRTYRIELPMPTNHVVFKTAPEFNGDLNVTDVTSMNHRPTSLDTDARLIPPRNETSCLGSLRGVEKIFVLVWNFADHIESLLLIFYGVEECRHSAVRCVFDPGGDASPKLLLPTIFVAS